MPDMLPIAAMLLLGAALFAGRAGTGDYLRFASILLAALALAILSGLDGLAAASALVALPLSGASLFLSALARGGRRAPPALAAMLLAAALAAGLFAFFAGQVTPVLLPLAFAGVALLLTARTFAMLSGLLLLAAAAAGLGEGISAGTISLLAASLFGAGLYRRASKAAPSLAAVSP